MANYWTEISNQLEFASEVGLLVIALFAFVASILNIKIGQSFVWLACVFAAIAISSMPTLHIADAPALDEQFDRISMFGFFATSFLLAPLLYGYVLTITSPKDGPTIRSFWPHFLFAIPATIFAFLYLTLPLNLSSSELVKDIAWFRAYARTIIYALIFMQCAIFVQWTYYGSKSFFVLKQYRREIKQFYANLNDKDLFWIQWILAAFVTYAFLSVADAFVEIIWQTKAIPALLDRFMGFAICFSLALFGLRQMPALSRATKQMEASAASPRYANSGIDLSDMQRIAQKLEKAMHEDQLYLDPDLSLTRLSNRLGINANYISQTLNEHINKSFFDYVNFMRIEFAANELQNTDQSVLDIAYASGFNSRSAFYRAFSKEKGLTPTAYRDKNR